MPVRLDRRTIQHTKVEILTKADRTDPSIFVPGLVRSLPTHYGAGNMDSLTERGHAENCLRYLRCRARVRQCQ